MARIFLDEKIADPNLTIVISHEKLGTWTGFDSEGGASIAGNAEYATPFADLMNPINDFIRTAGMLGAMVGSQKMGELASSQFISKNMTSAVWTGSGAPAVAVSFTLVNTHEGMDSGRTGTNLVAASYPTENKKGILKSPGGYKPPIGQSARPEGLWTVTRGRWFRADNLILKSATVTYAKSMDKSSGGDKPISAIISASFEPYRMMTADEVSAWYLGSGSSIIPKTI